MKALSRNRRSLKESLALARQGMEPTTHEQERVGRALRVAGLAVPLGVAPSLAAAAQAASVLAAATSTSASAAPGSAVSGTAVGGAATSAAVTGTASGSATAAALGGKLIAGKVVAAKVVAALALAGAGTIGLHSGYTLLTTQPSAPVVAVNTHPTAVAEREPKALVSRSAPRPVGPSGTETPVVPNATNGLLAKPSAGAASAGAKPAQSMLTERRNNPTAATEALPSAGTVPFDPMVEDPVVVEMQHLKQVNRALSSGNPSLALQRLNELDQAIPGGALQQERQVSRVLTLCALGESAQALALTRRLLQQNDSFYSRRLKHSCGAH